LTNSGQQIDYWNSPTPGQFDTPANGSWFVNVRWTVNNASASEGVDIYFLPTFGVDYTKTGDSLVDINKRLSATIEMLNNYTLEVGIQNFEMWELINWIYVVQYWSLLYDVGQVQPTLYERTGPFPDTYVPNEYTDTNNIFVNDILFGKYGSYFTNTIVPLLRSLGDLNGDVYSFQSLDSINQLDSIDVAFKFPYICTQSQLKTSLSLIIAVLVANYPFINPVFGFIVIFGAWYQRKKNPRDGTLILFV
jgi:hypothetical protein